MYFTKPFPILARKPRIPHNQSERGPFSLSLLSLPGNAPAKRGTPDRSHIIIIRGPLFPSITPFPFSLCSVRSAVRGPLARPLRKKRAFSLIWEKRIKRERERKELTKMVCRRRKSPNAPLIFLFLRKALFPPIFRSGKIVRRMRRRQADKKMDRDIFSASPPIRPNEMERVRMRASMFARRGKWEEEEEKEPFYISLQRESNILSSSSPFLSLSPNICWLVVTSAPFSQHCPTARPPVR